MKQLLNWFRRGAMEKDLERELGYHLDRRVGDLMQSGLPEWEAKRRATLELGGLAHVQEEVRDVWLTRWCAISGPPLLAALFFAQSLVHRHDGALAHPRYRCHDGDLLAG